MSQRKLSASVIVLLAFRVPLAFTHVETLPAFGGLLREKHSLVLLSMDLYNYILPTLCQCHRFTHSVASSHSISCV